MSCVSSSIGPRHADRPGAFVCKKPAQIRAGSRGWDGKTQSICICCPLRSKRPYPTGHRVAVQCGFSMTPVWSSRAARRNRYNTSCRSTGRGPMSIGSAKTSSVIFEWRPSPNLLKHQECPNFENYRLTAQDNRRQSISVSDGAPAQVDLVNRSRFDAPRRRTSSSLPSSEE